MVKKYSEFINYPIKFYMSKEIRKQVPVEEEKKDEKAEEGKTEEQKVEDKKAEEAKKGDDEKKAEDAEIKDEGENKEGEKKKEPETKTVTEQVWEWEVINEVKAIWIRDKSQIKEDEYNNFYKTITKDHENPLAMSHFTAEGEIEFKAILYVPKAASYDLFENYYGRSSALKLYVRRVLITEEFEELMPRYLNFIKGVVDSDDLPLNVSREQLQQLKMIKVMSKKLVRKVIDMIRQLAEDSDEEEDDDEDEEDDTATKKDEKKKDADGKEAEKKEEDKEKKEGEDKDKKEGDEVKKEEENKYHTFWKNFGKNIKLGVIEDASNRSKLAKLLR